MVSLRRTRPSDDDFAALVKELDRELFERYPEFQDDNDFLNIVPSDARVVVAYDNGVPVGCGCFKDTIDPGEAELKRMFVRRDSRGRGISKLICGELEKWAAETGYRRMILETGVRQPEAIGLYESAGFRKINNYGEYQENGMSVCMEKVLIICKQNS